MNGKTVRKVLRDSNLSLPARRCKGSTKSSNLFYSTAPDQMWETDITYIPTESGMTYLMCIKDTFTKEWQVYRNSRSCMAKDAVRLVENAVMSAFDGPVPEDLVLSTGNCPQHMLREFRNALKILGI